MYPNNPHQKHFINAIIAKMKKCPSPFFFFCFSWALHSFKKISVTSWGCLDVAGNSMLTFRVLPHWNIVPDTWHDIPPSYIILTLSWPFQIPNSAFLMLSACQRAASTIFKVFGMTWTGIEPATSQSQRGHSTNWATVPVQLSAELVWQKWQPIRNFRFKQPVQWHSGPIQLSAQNCRLW